MTVKLCANRHNNSEQCRDLQWIVGRIQLIRLCKPCVMPRCGPNNFGRAEQTDPTLLCHALVIMEQKKCWELLAQKFDQFQTLRNNSQPHATTCNRVCEWTKHIASSSFGSCWPTMLRLFAHCFKMPNIRLTSFEGNTHFLIFLNLVPIACSRSP